MTGLKSNFLYSVVLAGFAFCGAVHAQSSVQIYGAVDLAVGRFQAAGAPNVTALNSGSMTTSYIGFRGTEDLGGGLRALFVLESYMRNDSGEPGRFTGDAFWGRDSFVGLSGDFGTVKLGRITTPLFVSSLLTNAFSSSFGFSPSMRHWFAGGVGVGVVTGDTGWNNAIRYDSPKFGGASFSVMGNLGEKSPTAVGNNLTAQVLYTSGPWVGAATWQQVKNATSPLPAGLLSQNTWQLGTSYNFGVAKAFAQYGQVETDAAANRKTKIVGIGASVPIGPGALLAQYGQGKNSGSATNTRRTASIGYDYNLSKRTDVYTVFMHDKNTGQSTGHTYAVGLRHAF